jgi:hypothetical protein
MIHWDARPACTDTKDCSLTVKVTRAAGECPKVIKVEGWVAPSQGVWQDDYTFADKATKQLRRNSLTSYTAELPMVKGRHSLLFGIFRPVGEKEQERRDNITIKGEANGTMLVPVKFRFTVMEGGESRPIYTSEVRGTVPLGGPCGDSRPFEVTLPSPQGIPPDEVFTFNRVGDYTITAELVRGDDTPTGIKVTVSGKVVETKGPKVHFLPAILSPATDQERNDLKAASDKLADNSATKIPDYFPLAPGGLPTVKEDVRDLSDAVKKVDAQWVQFLRNLFASVEERRIEALLGELNDQIASGALLGDGGQVVVVLHDDDFDRIVPLDREGKGADGATVSQKVSFVRSSVLHDQVAHELIHTLPFPTSEDEMTGWECGIDYHNKEEAIAHGHRMTRNGRPATEDRVRIRNNSTIMGALVPGSLDTWMTQCEYWHVLHQLIEPPDPALILVRGRLARSDTRAIGELFPAYQLEGVADLGAGSRGDWAIVLRSSFGLVLGRFPFTPVWNIPIDPLVEPFQRQVLSFAYRVPDLRGVAQIDLVGPGSVLLDSHRYSRTAPSVVITTPTPDATVQAVDGKVRAEWMGRDADGDALLYTVLYSPDGGETWLDVMFEQTKTTVDVPVNTQGNAHMVKVIATDGARSHQTVVRFSLAKGQ